jgi:hypothetical protein
MGSMVNMTDEAFETWGQVSYILTSSDSKLGTLTFSQRASMDYHRRRLFTTDASGVHGSACYDEVVRPVAGEDEDVGAIRNPR